MITHNFNKSKKSPSTESAKALGRWAPSIKICILCLERSKTPLKSNKKRRLGTNHCILFCVLIWRRLRDSNPRGFWPNGFQDFLTNLTLPQNNRKYQTIENAEKPVKSRAFGVLSFPKPETVDGARISVSKTISKTFLEKSLDKSAPNAPVASHIISAKSASTD